MWDGSSIFTIKKVWNVIRSPSQRVPWAHLVWFRHHVPRHSFLLWLALRGRLATQDRLLSYGLVSDIKCYLCLGNVEDHNHLFFECAFSRRVWTPIATMCDLSTSVYVWETLWPRLSSHIQGFSLLSTIRRLALGASLYYIWQERNSRKHGHTSCNERRIATAIIDTIRNKLNGASFPLNRENLHLTHLWLLPDTLLS